MLKCSKNTSAAVAPVSLRPLLLNTVCSDWLACTRHRMFTKDTFGFDFTISFPFLCQLCFNLYVLFHLLHHLTTDIFLNLHLPYSYIYVALFQDQKSP